MDVRPQAHDIIRTWLFSTILRSHLDHDVLPWQNAAISGWVLDPDRKKMSKSKGNVVTPMHLLEEHGADAVRYWAASGRPGHGHGVRRPADEGRPPLGDQAAERVQVRARRPAARGRRARRHPLDRAMIARLAAVVDGRHAELRGLRLRARARAHRELLLVVLRLLPRARQGPALRPATRRRRRRAARCALSLSVFQRLFAPFLPFVAEEVWSWWQEGSVHRASWPSRASWPMEGSRRSRTSAERESLGARRDGGCAAARCARPSPRRGRRCARPSRGWSCTTRRAAAGARAWLGRPALAGSIEHRHGCADEFAVEVELAGNRSSTPVGLRTWDDPLCELRAHLPAGALLARGRDRGAISASAASPLKITELQHCGSAAPGCSRSRCGDGNTVLERPELVDLRRLNGAGEGHVRDEHLRTGLRGGQGRELSR